MSFDREVYAIHLDINPIRLSDILVSKLPERLIYEGKSVSTQTAKGLVLGAISDRLSENGSGSTVELSTDDGPNTFGTISDKYIEVDISQQRMFLFENKTQVATFPVSTGSQSPTPTGTYRILNKAPMAFSSIFNVWMPNWMAFAYDATYQAYYGIHELAYEIAEDGSVNARPSGNVGVPSTGGCVALLPGDSDTVYAFADIGMPVYIVQ